ncbi:MAG: hypothetical protein WDM91_15690 [Rhizomicrobium sp.]
MAGIGLTFDKAVGLKPKFDEAVAARSLAKRAALGALPARRDSI